MNESDLNRIKEKISPPGSLLIKGPGALKGTVRVSGSKNAVLPILAATLITDKKCTIRNVPDLTDISIMVELLKILGKKVAREGTVLYIEKEEDTPGVAPYELVRMLRASILVMGALAAGRNSFRVAMPGGCLIGERPIDIHLKGLKKMGAEIKVSGGFVELDASGLKGSVITLDFPSVGATENLAIAACGTTDKTVLENIAVEPEIEELFSFLKSLGAKVKHRGSSVSIKGRSRYGGADFTVMDDRIQAGTYVIAGAVQGSDVRVEFSSPETLDALVEKLIECGCFVDTGSDYIHIRTPERLKSTDIRTSPYPGFPTDLQAPFTALMSCADGVSVVNETVFENRFLHCGELKRMGADIEIKKDFAVVQGVEKLTGAPVAAKDLRGGASLVIAGLLAQGVTRIIETDHIWRGYEDITGNFKKLGAEIWTE